MTLIAEKPFKWMGRALNRGDVVEPAPEGRTLYALLDQRRIAYADGRPSHVDERPVTFVPAVCDVCGFTAVSERALGNHENAVHSGAPTSAQSDAPTVSASPGAPEPAGEPNPPSPPAGALPCPDCDRSFAGAQGLKVHRSRAHAGA